MLQGAVFFSFSVKPHTPPPPPHKHTHTPHALNLKLWTENGDKFAPRCPAVKLSHASLFRLHPSQLKSMQIIDWVASLLYQTKKKKREPTSPGAESAIKIHSWSRVWIPRLCANTATRGGRQHWWKDAEKERDFFFKWLFWFFCLFDLGRLCFAIIKKTKQIQSQKMVSPAMLEVTGVFFFFFSGGGFEEWEWLSTWKYSHRLTSLSAG